MKTIHRRLFWRALRAAITLSDWVRKTGPLRVLAVAVVLCGIAVPLASSWVKRGLPKSQVAKGHSGRGAKSQDASAAGYSVATFAAPGGGTVALSGTLGLSIDGAGDVTGTYLDTNFLAHGFIRTASGTVSSFDVPGAATSYNGNSFSIEGTIPTAINAAGTTTGSYIDSKTHYHGFLRTIDGTITAFDASGGIAPAGCYCFKVGTRPIAINSAGAVTGTYFDENGTYHGFLRASNGVISSFDISSAGTSPYWTNPLGIDTAGDVVGTYVDESGNYHGFVRSAAGSVTTFDAPNAAGYNDGGNRYEGTIPLSMNDSGVVTGAYTDANLVRHGFVRLANGTITSFDAPGAGGSGTGSSSYYGTAGFSIDPNGNVAGMYLDTNSVFHGFVRSTAGAITTFDVPGAGSSILQGTGAFSITAEGQVAGTFADSSHVFHGFVLTPTSTGAATVTQIGSSPNPSFYGETVTLTAQIAASSGGSVPADGESVTFLNGSATLGTGKLSGGVASLTTTALQVGNNGITAVYGGDSTYAGSTSLTYNQPVGKSPSSTVLISSLNPSDAGQPVSFTATVTGEFGGQPTGTVTFSDGSSSLGTVSLSGSSQTSIQTSALAVGSHAITASYGGDTNYAASSSGTVTDVVNPSAAGLQFIPVTPCRVVDTRGATGAFGAPALGAAVSREFDIPQSACRIPSTAVAYSLNVTVLPETTLNYLTLWPSGTAQPNVSTLNSYDGRVKANAAIVPAGANGGVNVFVSDGSQVILDVDGYFVPAGTASALAFYPLTPCRVADTRGATGALSGPFLASQSSRSFPLQSSTCGIPATAQAYSLNVTTIPHKTLNYLTTWPTGQSQPNVSTLNAPTGAVTANAAIVPAGSNGDISLFVSDDADVILDVNGYFAPVAAGGLSLYTTTPCRVLDTRGLSGAFNGVLQTAVETSTCALPAAAKAYVLNATVVPPGPLNYLTLWPDGEGQPNVSTLNADDAAITSNMAVVPTNNGKIDTFSSNLTQLILDISSYFAP